MRALEENCYPCLEKLARKTAELAGSDNRARAELMDKGISYLSEIFSESLIPTTMAGEIQRVIRREANCRDPFAEIKQKEMDIAKQFSDKFYPPSSAGLMELIKYAVKGNSIDFFVSIDKLSEEIKKPVTFSHDDAALLLDILKQMHRSKVTKKILYLVDNAGECFFDLPLVKRLELYGNLYYVVKEAPVQNDLTMDDLKKTGIRDRFKNVITSGTDTPGLDLSLASPEFMSLYYDADLIIAKGMGHYETLTEVELPAPTFLLMKAKCRPIALSLGVNLNSYTAIKLK